MKFTIRNIFVFMLVFGGSVHAQLPKTGLFFYSHDYNIDKRTSLILNNGKPYSLDTQDRFTLDFDFYLRNPLIKFGYIFRIISDTGENFDLMVNNDSKLFFITSNRDLQLKNMPLPEEWNHISVVFDKKSNAISFRFNGETADCAYELKKIHSLSVSFGLCEFKNFLANDVPPFILKNVQISYNGKALHHWSLDRHGNNEVYDGLRNMPAIARHSYWLMDNRIYWRKAGSVEAEIFPQVTFDSVNNSLYILRNNELVRFSLLDDSTSVFPSNVTPNALYNNLLFDPLTGKLLLYGFGSGQTNSYDFERKSWVNAGNRQDDADYAQHNRYISRSDSALYVFGGYGHYKYNSHFSRVNPATQDKITFDFSNTITPRYLAAMGGNRAGDKIYILGGRGSEMGRQELSPKNFSDLFEVDVKTGKVKHLFDIVDKEDADANVYSNSLVTANNDSLLYVLAYPSNKYSSAVRLKSIDLKTQEVKTLADSIEFYFRDVTAFCDLYYSSRLAKLVAVAAYTPEDLKKSVVDIYTLDFPPLQVQDIIQARQAHLPSNRAVLYIFIATLCVLMLLFVVRKKLFFPDRKIREATPGAIPVGKGAAVAETLPEPVKPVEKFYDFKKKSILFLGGFQVFDKDGKNITGDFTPTLKYILVLIVLYTLKNNKGISSSKLQELLWFDKTEEAARNNRSVNVRKLRVLLQSLGNIDITNENSYWTISSPDNILLDYKEALRLIQKIKDEPVAPQEAILRLLELLDAGAMLPNIQFEWVDNFKNDFSNAVIDVLMQVANNKHNAFYDNQDVRLRIAGSMLHIDPINEEALVIKCKALDAMGKKGLAKAAFDNFAKEYKLLLGESYSGSIKNLINP